MFPSSLAGCFLKFFFKSLCQGKKRKEERNCVRCEIGCLDLAAFQDGTDSGGAGSGKYQCFYECWTGSKAETIQKELCPPWKQSNKCFSSYVDVFCFVF